MNHISTVVISNLRSTAERMEAKAKAGVIVRRDILGQADRLRRLADELEESAKAKLEQARMF